MRHWAGQLGQESVLADEELLHEVLAEADALVPDHDLDTHVVRIFIQNATLDGYCASGPAVFDSVVEEGEGDVREDAPVKIVLTLQGFVVERGRQLHVLQVRVRLHDEHKLVDSLLEVALDPACLDARKELRRADLIRTAACEIFRPVLKVL